MRLRSGALMLGLATMSVFMVRTSVGAAPKDDVKTITITQKTATSSFFTANFNFDIVADPTGSANMAIYRGEGSMGNFTGEGVSQSKFTGVFCYPDAKGVLDPFATPPAGEFRYIQLALVGHLATTKFERTGDLLFERGGPTALVACLDTHTLIFHEVGKVKIIGGTGDFAGATGEETVVQDGQVLNDPINFPHLSPNAAFGFSKGSFVATFTVPKK